MALQPNASTGFSTGSKVLIVAMLGFYFLGYSVFISICLGLVAGLTSGFISSWKNAYEDFVTPEPAAYTPKPKPEATVVEATSYQRPEMRPGFGVKPVRRKKYQTRGQRRFGWLFRQNKP
jgi:hypothetical protein